MASSEGIRARHSRGCASRNDARCDCKPTYEAFVYLPREGKKVRRSFPTLAAAKSWRADAKSRADRGKMRSPTQTTLRDAWREFHNGAKDGSIPSRDGRRYKPATLRGYERSMRLRVLPDLGARRLSDITRADVQDLAERLTGHGLAASTIQNTLDPLRRIYARAIRRDVVAVDPTEGLELRRSDGKRDRIASPEEATVLLAALNDTDRAIYAAAMFAGLRRGELRALRWSDVDLPGRRIHVARGWDDKEGEQDGKSAAADRTVPIVKPLARELAAHKLRTGRDGTALVFGATAEQPFDPTGVRRRALAAWGWRRERQPGTGPAETLVKARQDALEPIGLHESRHTCASGLIAAGANAKTISTVMGHASIAITFDVYGHLMPGGLEEALERFDAFLDRAGAR
jgi:integrase